MATSPINPQNPQKHFIYKPVSFGEVCYAAGDNGHSISQEITYVLSGSQVLENRCFYCAVSTNPWFLQTWCENKLFLLISLKKWIPKYF